ncbi:MAG: glutathione S-transferase family protein [Rhodospirillales bacterium]|nr:MAG: glutathione S-transferase family protein [Rhodospirillales bacterium]
MLLYEHPLSSYAQKVKIALREKGLPFTPETPATLGSGAAPSAFTDANPRVEVPTLIDGEARIFDSTIILEYIEDKWPTPPLLPSDPVARAGARMVEEMCDTHYEAINWGLGEIKWFRRAEGARADTLRAAAAAQTRHVQSWLAERLGAKDWFGGDAFGWADLSVAPYLNRSVYYGLGPAADSPLSRWLARARERPSVALTFTEFDAAADRMAGAADRLASGTFRREYRDHRLEWMVKSGGIQVVLDGLAKDNIRFSWPPSS